MLISDKKQQNQKYRCERKGDLFMGLIKAGMGTFLIVDIPDAFRGMN